MKLFFYMPTKLSLISCQSVAKNFNAEVVRAFEVIDAFFRVVVVEESEVMFF